MVDPITASGAVAKIATSAADGAGEAATNVLTRLFGPAADEIGEALRRWTSYRVGNVEKIVEAADRKSADRGRQGIVNPRVTHTILEEGSFCDDELMGEYLGGVLAAGRTPSGRDDRGVSWSKLVTTMSALQLRSHFVLYREWAHALHGRSELNLGTDSDKAEMFVRLDDFVRPMMEMNPESNPNSLLVHVVSGLSRLSLIGNGYAAGSASQTGRKFPAGMPFTTMLRVQPTLAGIELYGWACGMPGLAPAEFLSEPGVLELHVDAVLRLPVWLPLIAADTAVDTATVPNGA